MEDTSALPRKALTAGKDPKWAELVLKQIAAAGYEADSCSSAQEIFKRMTFTSYELVILDEEVVKEEKRLLPYLATIPLQVRRKALYVLTGAKYQTMNALAAFSLGVDGLINHQDLHQLAACINALRKEHAVLYREFSKFVD